MKTGISLTDQPQSLKFRSHIAGRACGQQPAGGGGGIGSARARREWTNRTLRSVLRRRIWAVEASARRRDLEAFMDSLYSP